jgi:hypothetical protein
MGDNAFTETQPGTRKMETYKNRQYALAMASHLERCANPAGYIKRKKVTVTALLTEYREAIRPHLQTECIAKAESVADATVSAARKWPTLETLRAESLAAMQREFNAQETR